MRLVYVFMGFADTYRVPDNKINWRSLPVGN